MNTYEKLEKNGLFINPIDIEKLCIKHKIKELSIFGSAIRDDFDEDSDVDLLVSFMNNMEIGLFEVFDVEEDLAQLLKRKIDIIPKEGLTLPVRKERILSTREIIYVSQ